MLSASKKEGWGWLHSCGHKGMKVTWVWFELWICCQLVLKGTEHTVMSKLQPLKYNLHTLKFAHTNFLNFQIHAIPSKPLFQSHLLILACEPSRSSNPYLHCPSYMPSCHFHSPYIPGAPSCSCVDSVKFLTAHQMNLIIVGTLQTSCP